MGAPRLLVVFDSVYVVALSAWVGAMLFFSFGVAPVVFKVLDAPSAARFVRALFPRYYAWCANAGAVALAALVCGRLTHQELRGPAVVVEAAVLLFGVLAMFHGGNVLTPAINAARDAGEAGRGRFDRLHKTSVRLNGLVLVLGLGLLVAFAARPMPRTAGVIEATPEEKARGAYEKGSRAIRAFEDERSRSAPGLR